METIVEVLWVSLRHSLTLEGCTTVALCWSWHCYGCAFTQVSFPDKLLDKQLSRSSNRVVVDESKFALMIMLFFTGRGASVNVVNHFKVSSCDIPALRISDSEEPWGKFMVPMGDVDGNGVEDIAVFSSEPDVPEDYITILLLNDSAVVNSFVISYQSHSGTHGTGRGITSVGDLTGDGVNELLVSILMYRS